MNGNRRAKTATGRKTIARTASAKATPATPQPSHVVGVGGSAGSLEPLERFFGALRPDTTMSFVVVTHRDPRSKEMMPAILSRFTTLPVREAAQDVMLEPGVVYVVPSDKHLDLEDGRVALRARPTDARARSPIDSLFRAIVADCRERSIGLVLSGMGTDGTVGLSAIKESLGIGLVQDPSSCTYDAMPRSAIEAGVADVVGTPERLAETLDGFVDDRGTGALPMRPSALLEDVLVAVRARTGHDFSRYKKNTLRRRIERRMNLRRVADIPQYLTLLERDPEEIDRLLSDLLIGVTRFFRDPAVFEALRTDVLPALLEGRGAANPVRAWVAACASGEEAYSLAIAIREAWGDNHGNEPLYAQIYATDLDEAAIRRARRAVYGGDIAADVSAERLARFFVREGAGYRVKQTIRDMVVFATQNVVSDPPFTKLDVLSCRNVLIYLESELQRKLLPLFVYALKPGGVLVLGASEGVDGCEESFKPFLRGAPDNSPRSRRHGVVEAEPPDLKIFERIKSTSRGGGQSPALDFPIGRSRGLPRAIANAEPTTAASRRELPELVQHVVVEHLAPPVIVVDNNGLLLYASRPTGRYLELPVGRVTNNVFAMARAGLALALRTGLRSALARGVKVTRRGVRVRTNGHDVVVDLSILPLREGELAGGAVIAFNEHPKDPRSSKKKKVAASKKNLSSDRAALARLRETKVQLDILMSEMRRSEDAVKIVNEELQSTNEELQSTNEELQSANEELTTSKEEMQSMNEELLTLNAELQTSNEQLATTNDDMRNLLNSSKIPTLFLDSELHLKRYTAEATRIARLMSSDVGRPITDLAWSLRYTTLARDVKRVLDTLVSMEVEVVADDGATYTMQVHPYRTIDDIIDGVVITFIDITAQRRLATAGIREERERLLTRMVERWPGVAWVEEVRTRRSLVVSAASEKLLGYTRSVLTEASGDFWRDLGRSKKRRGHGSDEALRLRGAGGLALYRRHAVVIATDEGGAPTHVLHFLRRRSTPVDGSPGGDRAMIATSTSS